MNRKNRKKFNWNKFWVRFYLFIFILIQLQLQLLPCNIELSAAPISTRFNSIRYNSLPFVSENKFLLIYDFVFVSTYYIYSIRCGNRKFECNRNPQNVPIGRLWQSKLRSSYTSLTCGQSLLVGVAVRLLLWLLCTIWDALICLFP